MKKLIIFTLLLLPLYSQYNIFVGDKIELNLRANVIEEEVEEAFKEFYIEELKDKNDSYKLVIRAKKPGMHTVRLEKSEIKIKVMPVSTNREFEKELSNGENIEYKRVNPPYYLLIFPLIAIALLIKKIKINKKNREVTIEEIFEKDIKTNDVFAMSLAFRNYLDKKLSTKFLAGIFDYDNKEIVEVLLLLEGSKYHKKEIDIEKTREKIMDIYRSLKEEKDV